jgi:hypothetical protein
LGSHALHFEKLKQATLSECHESGGIIPCNVIFLFILSFPPFEHDELWKICQTTIKDELVHQKSKIGGFPSSFSLFIF